jgi:hypothetical protein
MGESDISIPTLSLNINAGGGQRTFMSPVEDLFTKVGLTTPALRLGAGAAATGILLFFLKPLAWFDGSGEAKPWALWSDNPDAVVCPWWLTAFLAGLFVAVFV